MFLLALGVFTFLYKGAYSENAYEDTRLPVKMTVSYKKTNGLKSVKVQVTTKEDDKDVPVTGPLVNLYMNKVMKHDPATGLGWTCNFILDGKGEGAFTFSDSFKYITDGKIEFTFFSRMLHDAYYKDKEEIITIRDADIAIRLAEKDSKKTVTARFTEWKDSQTKAPVAGVAIRLFIKNKSGLLPVGKGAFITNKNGEVNSEILVPADNEDYGPQVLIARLENHERYGTVESEKELPGKVSLAKSSLILTWLCLTLVMIGILIYYSRSKKDKSITPINLKRNEK